MEQKNRNPIHALQDIRSAAAQHVQQAKDAALAIDALVVKNALLLAEESNRGMSQRAIAQELGMAKSSVNRHAKNPLPAAALQENEPGSGAIAAAAGAELDELRALALIYDHRHQQSSPDQYPGSTLASAMSELRDLSAGLKQPTQSDDGRAGLSLDRLQELAAAKAEVLGADPDAILGIIN